MLIFIDGCDIYDNASQIYQRWDTNNGGMVLNTTAGRFGGGAIMANSAYTTAPTYIGKYLAADTRTLFVGMSINLQIAANANHPIPIFRFITTGGTVQGDIVYDITDARFKLRVGSTILAESNAPTLSLDSYRYVEVGYHCDATAGWAEVRMDGNPTPILRFDGDTQNSTTYNYISEFRSYVKDRQSGFMPENEIRIMIDDIYICDDSGTTLNTFLGDNKVITTKPVSDVSQVGYTTSNPDGVTFYSEVDDDAADDDTTYVQADTVGNRVTFTHDGLTEIPDQILAVAVTHRTRKTEAGIGMVGGVVKVGANETVAPGHATASTYDYYQDFFAKQPDGTDWSKSAVDNLEFGLQVTG